nr:hypothetical protein [Legionella tunisiensis]
MATTILNYPKIDAKQLWGQLYGCSLPLAVAEYCQQKVGVKLIIAPDNLTAAQLLTELRFFLTDLKPQELLFFPIGRPCLMINFHHTKILFLNVYQL